MQDEQIDFLKQRYFELDKPVPYKNFFIHPVKVKDYYTFFSAVDSLLLDKNKDGAGIALSHLGYLFLKMQDKPEKQYNIRLALLIELCLQVDNGLFCDCGNRISAEDISNKIKDFSEITNPKLVDKLYAEQILRCKKCGKTMNDVLKYGTNERNQPYIRVENSILDKSDFEQIRKIICYQNMPDFNDEYIDPTLEQDLKDIERLKNKDTEPPTLEKQMCCIIANGCNYNFEGLQDITLRKFILLLKTADSLVHYRIYKQNENSGAVTFKGGLEHWIYQKKPNRLGEMMTYEGLQQKIGVAAK